MLLGLRILNDVAGVNTWQHTTELSLCKGSTQKFYFQLVDLSLDTPSQGFFPSGRRYCPAAPCRVQLQFLNLNNSKKLVKTCVQPFPTLDASIWCADILGTDPLDGTVTLAITVMESGRVLRGVVENGIVVR